MSTDSDIIDWFCLNSVRINEILKPLIDFKLDSYNTVDQVFHGEIQEMFYDEAISQIANEITKDLAIPVEMVYNIIEDKKLLINRLINVK